MSHQLHKKLYSWYGTHQVGGGHLPTTGQNCNSYFLSKTQTKFDDRAFLGLAGYYRKYILHFSGITAPLSDLTKGPLPNIVKWSEDCQTTVEAVKTALTSQPTLVNDALLILQMGVSGKGINAVYLGD